MTQMNINEADIPRKWITTTDGEDGVHLRRQDLTFDSLFATHPPNTRITTAKRLGAWTYLLGANADEAKTNRSVALAQYQATRKISPSESLAESWKERLRPITTENEPPRKNHRRETVTNVTRANATTQTEMVPEEASVANQDQVIDTTQSVNDQDHVIDATHPVIDDTEKIAEVTPIISEHIESIAEITHIIVQNNQPQDDSPIMTAPHVENDSANVAVWNFIAADFDDFRSMFRNLWGIPQEEQA